MGQRRREWWCTALLLAALPCGSPAQTAPAISVTGTPLPLSLVRQCFGRLPKGVGALDLTICNDTAERQAVLSSHVYQAMAASQPQVQAIGRDVMLSTLLRSHSHSAAVIAQVSLNVLSAAFAGLGSAKKVLSPALAGGVTSAALISQQVLNALQPLLASASQIEQFDRSVLEQALVLEPGSCAERTVFTVSTDRKNAPSNLSFHVR